MESIYGSIEKLTFYNEETGFGVTKVKLDYNDLSLIKYRDIFYSNLITVTCIFDRRPIIDEVYYFDGDVVIDERFGKQFKAKLFHRKVVDTLESVVKYLSSDMFPGIGEKTAQKIYSTLGSDCLKLIMEDKSNLDKIDLKDDKKDLLYNILIENKSKEEDTLGLINMGFTLNMAVKIISVLKNNVVSRVKSNPYMLIDLIEGFGFIKADNIALNNGIKRNDPIRIEAFINYFLVSLIHQSGDTYLEEATLKEKLFEALNRGEELIDSDSYDQAIRKLIAKNKIYIDEEKNIYNYSINNSENMLATIISDILKGEAKQKFELKEINAALEVSKRVLKIDYNEKQELAIKNALKENISIITGGPGTGKTTIIKGIIETYANLMGKDFSKERIVLLAPTGRASKRLEEVTKHSAQTIHRYLGYDGRRFKYGLENKVNCDVVIIDEFSMVDVSLASHLFSALFEDTRIIIVGDADQLPSVGPGEVLLDLIESKEVTTTKLDKIHRQAEDSTIISFAHSINNGYLPDNILERQHDRSFTNVNSFEIGKYIINIIKKALEKDFDLIKDIQVLIPIYRGKNGIDAINKLLQDEFNPKTGDEISSGVNTFRENDKVIQLVNRVDKGVMNGDIGQVTSIDKNEYGVKGMIVNYDFGQVYYEKNELDDLRLAYAISIHKAQGSEFSCAIIPFSFEYRWMLRRKLIYTGATRAKEYLIMLGDVSALSMGITGVEVKRKTKLLEKIKKSLNNNKLKFIDDKELPLSPFDFLD